MQSVSIQANVMTVSTGVDSGVESEGEGPPPAAGTQSKQDVTEVGGRGMCYHGNWGKRNVLLWLLG